MKYFILFNPLAGSGSCESKLGALSIESDEEKVFYDVIENGGYEKMFSMLQSDDKIVICGGDGTLNRFINGISDIEITNDILYFAAGSGNDFMNDINLPVSAKPVRINDYIKSLPTVTVKGKTYKFLNGVGLGVDGYVCSEMNRLREAKNKKVGYIPAAVKSLFKYDTLTKATVTVDGVTETYDRVWMASTMKGRFFGGGMKITPDQDRFDSDGLVSSIIAHNLSKIKIISLFGLIFKGTHTKYVKHVALKKCKEVKIEFDRPAILQIDGEAIPDVTSYTVSVKVPQMSANT